MIAIQMPIAATATESLTQRSARADADLLAFGVGIMIDRIRGWNAPCTEAFVRDTPRLADASALRKN